MNVQRLLTAAVVSACVSGAAFAQLTGSEGFPSSLGENAGALDITPSLTVRYGQDNAYARWRATGIWDAPYTPNPPPEDVRNKVPSTLPPPTRFDAKEATSPAERAKY
jgi:hypothetical protein